jgi:hypothetical protein
MAHQERRPCWQPFCMAAIIVVSGCDSLSWSSSQQPPTKTVRHAPTRSAAGTAATTPALAPAESTSADVPSFIGLAEDELVARLGPPAAQRDDQPPGRIWSYRQNNCTVDFTLYPDVQTRVYRALAYEVINDDNSAAAKRVCLAGLESRGRARTR